MGKRYFCDYCNRSFQDNLHNRKKHLFGVQHQRSKKVWYDFFRDAAAILADEQNKKPCRKFLQTGECDFGNNCRFSHMTEDDVQQLTAHIEVLRQQKLPFSSSLLDGHQCMNCHLPSIHHHLKDGRFQRVSSGDEHPAKSSTR
ncbi:zinc finger matrin-type protein 5 isoform X2 [Ambystoma mexicanum]|uniref:zinc finger matrin-type protein 5 isoform X2 n=1 Tax=Ambystoma mexicanum TaxID=8296 RepID=UPI0037E71ACE